MKLKTKGINKEHTDLIVKHDLACRKTKWAIEDATSEDDEKLVDLAFQEQYRISEELNQFEELHNCIGFIPYE